MELPRLRHTLAVFGAIASLVAACGGTAAPSPSPTAAPTVAAASPTVAASPTPSAKPKPTLLPVIDANTTKIALNKIAIPPIAGKTLSADILEVDQAAHLLYVTDRTDKGIDVFDVSTATAKYVKTIDVKDGANGLVVAKNVNKLFVGLNGSNIGVIDINPSSPTYQTLVATIASGGKKRVDEMDYDSKDKKLYSANSDDGLVLSVDATSNQILKKFDNLGEGLEQPRYDPVDGMMYMTSSDQNMVFEFDPTKDVMVKKADVGVKCNPNGLAINTKTNKAVLGCSIGKTGTGKTPITVSWDIATWKVIDQFDQVGAGDAVIYNAKADRFFFAASNFNRGGMMGIFSGDPIKFITNVPTAVGAHGVAYDETNNVVYTQDQNDKEGVLFSFVAPK
jgi:hypothetical protein